MDNFMMVFIPNYIDRFDKFQIKTFPKMITLGDLKNTVVENLKMLDHVSYQSIQRPIGEG